MKISEIIHKDAIIANLKSTDKKGVLEELAVAVSKTAGVEYKEILRVLLERELLGSTGIGGGIGIPHGKLNSISSVVVAIGISHKGVEFDSLDNKPVYIFFLLITPENSTGSHLRVLAQLSKLLKKTDFQNSLKQAKSADEITAIIHKNDEDF